LLVGAAGIVLIVVAWFLWGAFSGAEREGKRGTDPSAEEKAHSRSLEDCRPGALIWAASAGASPVGSWGLVEFFFPVSEVCLDEAVAMAIIGDEQAMGESETRLGLRKQNAIYIGKAPKCDPWERTGISFTKKSGELVCLLRKIKSEK